LIVVSDLDRANAQDQVEMDLWLRTLSMLRGRGHSISLIVPELGHKEAPTAKGLSQDLWRAAARSEARRVEEARRALGRIGVRVLTA
jgi:hypothetical protein